MRRKWFANLSLRVKAVGITVAITTVSLAIVAGTGVYQLRKQIAAEQRQTADSMALGFARASELAMAVKDTRELTRLANSFLRDENVLYIAAYDASGQRLALAVRDRDAWDDAEHGKIDAARQVVGDRPVEHTAQANEFSDDVQSDPAGGLGDGAALTSNAKSTALGHVVFGLSTAPAVAAQQAQTRLTALSTAGAAMAGALLLWLTLGGWMRRLQMLAGASESISRGDFSAPVADMRADEIGQLARAFDAMRAALQERDQQLRGFTDTLQEQVRTRTQDLETALHAAEAASRTKSLFLANMSHELRTPLNGVIGMVDLMLAADPNAQQRRYCDVAKQSARSLLELINDILDFSKIEAGKLELESSDFDLHETVEGVVQMLAERAEKKKIELACGLGSGVPNSMKGDRVRLRQVILNLISNALKFTDRGSVVVNVSLESEDLTHATVKFAVRDTGIGIPPDRVGKLFQSFSQVDGSTTRKFGGTGLGLAISHRIVAIMGGTIGVESEVGKGSTFWFTARIEKSAKAITAATIDPRGMRVLAIDDDTVNREVLRAQLTSWALRADVTENAASAIEMLRAAARENDPYRFAILNMQMARVDGVHLAQAIKGDVSTRETILISLSSISEPLKPNTMRLLGFAASLVKPTLPSQLYDAIINSLAARPAESASHAAEPFFETKLPGVKILLAEDNDVNRLVASELLANVGCVVSTAVNGVETLSMALQETFDVILMDCQMPEMDGFEATGKIREAEKADPKRPHRTIIALTANAIKGDRELCLNAGMDGYVTKPIDPHELMRTIRSFIDPQRAAELARAHHVAQAEASAKAESGAGSSTPLQAAASVPPVDIKTLRDRCMGNRKIAAKALAKFDTTIGAEVLALSESVKSRDMKAAAAKAHKIKGAAANVSAEFLRRIAGEMEQLARADALAQAEDCLDQLQRETERFKQYVETALGELAPREDVTPNANPSTGACA